MKLAEALRLRSDLSIRMEQLEERLKSNSKVQEGGEVAEDPEDLLKELDSVSSQLEELIWRINTTNSVVRSADGRTLSQLLAKRDVLIRKSSILRSFLDEASRKIDRYSSSEIRIQSTVDVRSLRSMADSISEEARLTDNMIQELNWTSELI